METIRAADVFILRFARGRSMIWVWLALWSATVAFCWRFRNRLYATFSGVILGIQVLVWWPLFQEPSALNYVVWAFTLLPFVYYALLVRPRMRSLLTRVVLSWPAMWFSAGSVLAIPWAVAAALGFPPHGWWLAYVVSFVGLVQSLTHRPSTLDLVLDGTLAADLGRAASGEPTDERPLRIAHVTDTHLGPFVSEARLRQAMKRVVAEEPDLVLLTGDFMTMESSSDPELLKRAFAPLRPIADRVYACRGNHDLEAPHVVEEAFDELGIQLLVDEEAIAQTDVGPVQLVGIDYKFQGARGHVIDVSESIPRRDSMPRVVLLHNPGHFSFIPDGLGDLVLSGHTHGGQVGLVDLGLDMTLLRLFTKKIPDQGFWAEGRNRLYVNRGLGHYGFPLRIGVRAEEALLRVHLSALVDSVATSSSSRS